MRLIDGKCDSGRSLGKNTSKVGLQGIGVCGAPRPQWGFSYVQADTDLSAQDDAGWLSLASGFIQLRRFAVTAL